MFMFRFGKRHYCLSFYLFLILIICMYWDSSFNFSHKTTDVEDTYWTLGAISFKVPRSKVEVNNCKYWSQPVRGQLTRRLSRDYTDSSSFNTKLKKHKAYKDCITPHLSLPLSTHVLNKWSCLLSTTPYS